MTRVGDLQEILDRGTPELSSAVEAAELLFLNREAARDRLLLRFARSLVRVRCDRRGVPDMMVLLRQLQLRAWRSTGGASPAVGTAAVRIPEDLLGGDVSQCGSYGLSAQPTGQGRIRVTPTPWHPAWLDDGADEIVNAACGEVLRRKFRRVAADPIVRRVHPQLTEYSCVGQREAVRAAFLSGPGSSTIVALPTGAGKSLAFQLPGLVAMKRGHGTVVVIVPTVALAIDQAVRFRDFALEAGVRALPSVSMVYHSGLSSDEKAEVRHAVSQGTTPILFTSPEACVGALGFPLRRAAEAGLIALFAVDEAHIVASWGDGFRPEFQALAGLRDQLLEIQSRGRGMHGGFRTLLLSATLTAEALATLERLFGEKRAGEGRARHVEIVAEAALRPEPSYLVSGKLSDADRAQNVLDALRHLPRPLILYVTTPKQAEDWKSRLLESGFVGVDSVVGGDMAERRGQDVLQRWMAGELDVVVATSAFGLGVDQSDVRSVVHACVPESIDRFYQEVGRGGRDGRACISLLAWTEGDVATAEALIDEVEISAERGLERWRAMLGLQPKRFDGDVLGVSLNALPSRYTISTSRNRSWNFRLLLRMARAGFIEFAGLPDPDAGAFETMTEEERGEWRARVGVRILDDRHDSEDAWRRDFERARVDARTRRDDTVAGFKKVITGAAPLHALFRENYDVPEYGLRVAAAKGDCPVTRTDKCVSHANPPAVVVVPRNLAVGCSPRLNELFKHNVNDGPVWVTYQPAELTARSAHRQLKEDLQRVFARLAAEGVASFSIPDVYVDERLWDRLAAESPWGFVLRTEDAAEDPLANHALATATLLQTGCTRSQVRAVGGLERDRHLILAPPDTPDPLHPNRRVADRPHLTLASLQRELDKCLS